jgi:transposase
LEEVYLRHIKRDKKVIRWTSPACDDCHGVDVRTETLDCR